LCVCVDNFFGDKCEFEKPDTPESDAELAAMLEELEVDTGSFSDEQWSEYNANLAAFASSPNLSDEDIDKALDLLGDGIENANSISELSALIDGVLNVGNLVNW
jgi:hypothetical protein